MSKSLRKAAARGGKYYRRVPKPGGGYRYYYTRSEYDRAHPHKNGTEERAKRMAKQGASSVEVRQYLAAQGLHPSEASRIVDSIWERPEPWRAGPGTAAKPAKPPTAAQRRASAEHLAQVQRQHAEGRKQVERTMDAAKRAYADGGDQAALRAIKQTGGYSDKEASIFLRHAKRQQWVVKSDDARRVFYVLKALL